MQKLSKTSQMSQKSDPVKILIGLLKLLMTPTIDSKTLINYVEQFKIAPDTYLPTIRGDGQIPLIYYCCSNPSLTDFFLYLIDKKINLNTQMICDDPRQQIELLYYSQIQYIPLLIENGCKLNPTGIVENAKKLVIKGNINKLITLYKHGAITKEQLSPILQENSLIFRILDQLYEKVYHLSQQVDNEQKFNEIYNEIIKSYINTFKFFFKNGVNINRIENGESFVQKVFNTYFVPLIHFVIDCQPNLNSEELFHYSNFGLLNRQVMKFIYNDNNFHVIENIIKDKLMPKKINVKKNLIKKIVPIT